MKKHPIQFALLKKRSQKKVLIKIKKLQYQMMCMC